MSNKFGVPPITAVEGASKRSIGGDAFRSLFQILLRRQMTPLSKQPEWINPSRGYVKQKSVDRGDVSP